MRLWRARDFRLLLVSSGLSALGDELVLIALTIKVFNLTHSSLWVSALLLAGILPMVLFAPLAGVLVDRVETRRALAAATAGQALVAAVLAFVSAPGAIVAFSFVLGCGAAIAQPALFALVPRVSGEEDVTEAQAYMETARYIGWVAGPVLAGGLAAGLGTGAALLADAATFVVMLFATLALTVRRPPTPRADGEEKERFRDGWKVLVRDRLVLLAVIVLAGNVLFAAIDNVAEVFFAKRVLGAGDWGYGALAASWLLGMVIGAAFIARRLPAMRLAAGVLLAGAGGGAAIAFAAGFPRIGLALIAFLLGGMCNGIENVSIRSLIAHRIPDRYRGRVFAAVSGLVFTMQIGATAIGGVLVGAIGARLSLLIAGVGAAAVGLVGFAIYNALPSAEREVTEPSADHF